MCYKSKEKIGHAELYGIIQHESGGKFKVN